MLSRIIVLADQNLGDVDENQFTAANDAHELQQLIRNQLIIGKATINDTQQFLSQQGLHYSREIKQGEKYFDMVFNPPNSSKDFNFDSCIGSRIPIAAKKNKHLESYSFTSEFPSSRLVSWDYGVRFYFDKGILVGIIAEKTGTGF